MKFLHTYSVNMSAYNTTKDQCGNNLGITASGKKAKPGVTIAVSRDLQHYMGYKAYIPNLGIFEVEDLMHPRYKKSIDLCMAKWTDAINFGRKDGYVFFYKNKNK